MDWAALIVFMAVEFGLWLWMYRAQQRFYAIREQRMGLGSPMSELASEFEAGRLVMPWQFFGRMTRWLREKHAKYPDSQVEISRRQYLRRELIFAASWIPMTIAVGFVLAALAGQ